MLDNRNRRNTCPNYFPNRNRYRDSLLHVYANIMNWELTVKKVLQIIFLTITAAVTVKMCFGINWVIIKNSMVSVYIMHVTYVTYVAHVMYAVCVCVMYVMYAMYVLHVMYVMYGL